MFSWTFGVCFFHLNIVCKILGGGVENYQCWRFYKVFYSSDLLVHSTKLVMGYPVTPRVPISCPPAAYICLFCYSWNTEFKREHLKYLYSKNITQRSTSENIEKKCVIWKNVTYKGSCLPAREFCCQGIS